MAVLQLLPMFIAVSGLHVISANPHNIEADYNVNVTEGDSATLMHAVSGVTEEYTILWFIHDVNFDYQYCDIDASPTRVVQADDIGLCHETYSRFQGCVIEHAISTDDKGTRIDQYQLVIPDVQFSDTKYSIGFVSKRPLGGTVSRTSLLTESVRISVFLLPVPTASFNNHTTDTKVRASAHVVGGSVAACLIILLLIIVILLNLVFKRRRNENNNQKQSKNLNGNTIAPLEVTISGNGFLNGQSQTDTSSSRSQYQNASPKEPPIYALSNKQKYAHDEVPTYALPNKNEKPDAQGIDNENVNSDEELPTYYNAFPNKKHDTQNTNNETVSSDTEIPTYALPNKKKTNAQNADENTTSDQQIPTYALPNKKKHGAQSTDNENVSNDKQIPTYALPNKKKPITSGTDPQIGPELTYNTMYENEGDGSIYYSQVPIENEEFDMEDSNLAYSVVNLKEKNKARNVEGLDYADVNLPDAQRSVISNNNETDDTTVAYSEVKY